MWFLSWPTTCVVLERLTQLNDALMKQFKCGAVWNMSVQRPPLLRFHFNAECRVFVWQAATRHVLRALILYGASKVNSTFT